MRFVSEPMSSVAAVSEGRVVILGAGAAGLAAAYELTHHGRAVTVLEAKSYVGGLCRTVLYKGYRFDLGGHRWFTQNRDLDAWFHRLMGAELVPVDRISRIHFDGRYFLYPIDFADLIRQKGLLFIVEAGSKFLWASLTQQWRSTPPVDMQQAYVAQFGSRLFEMFFRRYTEKVWGRPCTELSADWVAQRSKGLSVWSLLKDALGAKTKDLASLIDRFHYPAMGYGRMPERLAEEVIRQGGEVHLNSRVSGLICHGPNDFEVVVESAAGPVSSRCDSVLSTLPLGQLVGMLTPACPPEVLEAAQGLSFRDLITVNLIIGRPRVSSDTWVYVQDEDVLFGRLHEPKNWSSAMVPDEQHTSLVLECFCSRGDELWAMDDQAIVRRCVEDLEVRLGLLKADEVEDFVVVRTLNAYPVYDLAYAGKLDLIKRHLATLEGLHILGRSGSFRYNNADHSVEMGLLLGRRLLGHDLDHLGVNTEAQYHESIPPSAGPARDRFVLDPLKPMTGQPKAS